MKQITFDIIGAPALKTEIRRYEVIRERILAVWPAIDSDTLTDTMEGITDLQEMIAAVIRSALVDEALQVGLRARTWVRG